MSKLKGRIAPFNPGSMNPELLQELLVGKNKILKTLVENIVSSAKEKSAPPQQLIVGPRGYGKTHLINVVRSKLKKNKVFKKDLLVAFFNEEEHVSGYLDFLRRVLQALKKDCPDPTLEEAFEQIFANPSPAMVVQTESFLNQYIGERLLVILCENLGEIFEGLEDEGQKKLRAFLQNSGKISLLCTTQKLYEPLKARNLPFYGFFCRTELEPFNDQEAWKLLKRLSDNADDSELSGYLNSKEGKARVAAVCELTNGNPRLIALLSGFLNKEKLEGLTDAFLEMIETSLTPYYQEQMARLAPLQKRIIEILCEKGDGRPMSVKGIAGKALTTSQSISHQLKKMTELGVLLSAKKGRETFYGMAEPLWRVSIEVKNNQEGILPVVVEFIKITKSLDEIYASISESNSQGNIVYAHMVCALRDRYGSLEDEGRTAFLRERLVELANVLPDDLKKAESYLQALMDMMQGHRVLALLSVIKLFNETGTIDDFEVFKESDDAFVQAVANVDVLRDLIGSKREIRNYLIVLKFILFREAGQSYPLVLKEIVSGEPRNILCVIHVLTQANEIKSAVEWLIKTSKDPKNCQGIKQALLGLDYGDFLKDSWLKVIFPAFKEFNADFFNKDPQFYLALIHQLIDSDMENETLELLSILGGKLSEPEQLSISWVICRLMIQKNSKVLTFWEVNNKKLVDIFSRWKDSDLFISMFLASEALVGGNRELMAEFPLEFQESLMKAKTEVYFSGRTSKAKNI